MYTLGTHLEALLSAIHPPKDRLEAARDLPPRVRDFLRECETFPTLAPHTRLVGSYAQNMSVGDVKDVDLLVRVEGNPKANNPQAKRLIQSLRSALDILPEALGYEGWAGVDVERARRSVHIYIKGRDFHLDVVPCIAPDGLDKPIWVPDREFDRWIPSHPVGYIQLLDDLNTTYCGKVKCLGRLIKHFRDYHMKQRKPKSYWLGALMVYHVRRKNGLNMSQPLAVIFRDLLEAIHAQYDHLLWTSNSATPRIPDPMLGHDISWNWSRAHFETFMRRIDEGRDWATHALESEDRSEAIMSWQKVFGREFFPSQIDEMASGLAAVGLPGRAVVSGTGLVTAIKPASGMSIVTRPTTFHGQE